MIVRRAYLLAGGHSLRFGSDKARVLRGGEPNVVRLARELEWSGYATTLVTQDLARYADLSVPSIADFVPDAGPLAGVLTALTDALGHGDSAAIIATCDLFEWRAAWGLALQAAFEPTTVRIVSLEGPDFAPFPGLFSTALLPMGIELWNRGGRSMRELHQWVGTAAVVAPWDGSDRPRTFNTRAEWQRCCDSAGENGADGA